jgi:hypothetical protein
MTRRWISSALIVAMVSAIAPLSGWAAETTPAAGTAKGGRLQSAIRQAAAASAATPALQLQSQPPAPAPAKTGVRKQSSGGGHAGMIIGLVTAAAGIGATVYMVKEMEKTTKNVATPY